MQVKSRFLAMANLGVTSALQFTNRNFYNIQPGIPFNITWSNASGPVTLTLLAGGTPGYMKKVQTLASKYSPPGGEPTSHHQGTQCILW